MSGRERDALLGNDAERARRKTAIEGVERSSANADRLEQTARTAMESAQTGENIMSKLHDQREKILSARASAGAGIVTTRRARARGRRRQRFRRSRGEARATRGSERGGERWENREPGGGVAQA